VATLPDGDPAGPDALPAWAARVPARARRFQGQRAGFVTRALAAVVDAMAIALFLGAVYLGWFVLRFVLAPTSFTPPTVPFAVVLLAGAVTSWLFLTVAWTTTGRTLGARVMGVRVVNYEGKLMRPYGAAVRAAFCLGFMPGMFWVIISRQNRSLQDTVLRTSVIHDWTKRPAAREAKSGS
jgi:uncharacterized RDD family membrane protein YckC